MKAGTLEIDLIANVARLQADMQAMKKAVSAGMSSVSSDAAAADMALSRVGSGGITKVTDASRVGAHHVQNFAFQMQDLGIQMVAAAGSSHPLKLAFTALMQQGSQIQGIMMQSGVGIGGLVKQLLVMTKVISLTADAELAAAASTSRATAQVIARELERAESAGIAAAAEIALAEASLLASAGTDGEAVALARLSKARKALAVSQAEAKVASEALVGANAAASESATAAAAAEGIALAPLGAILLAVAAAAGVAYAAFKIFQGNVDKSGELKNYAKQLGLTKEEIEKAGGATVTLGDTTKAVFQVAGKAIWTHMGGAITSVWNWMKGWLEWIGSGIKVVINFIIGSWVGAYNTIIKAWNLFPAAVKDIFYQGVNGAIDAINLLIKFHINAINFFIRAANVVTSKIGLNLPEITAPQIAHVSNEYAGAAKKVGGIFREEMGKALAVDYVGDAWAAIRAQAIDNAKERLRGARDKTKGKKDGVDKHAESLARDAAAAEAAIKGLWDLADAYRVSDAEALRVAATNKGIEQGIKKQGDIAAFVARELRKEVAQRAADAGKTIADLRWEAITQTKVNEAVADGTLAYAGMADMLSKLNQLRPLLAARDVAEKMGDTEAVKRLTGLIGDLTKAIDDNNVARDNAKALGGIAQANDDIETAKLELSLLGKSNRERVIALALLRAEQYVRNNMRLADPALQKKYVDSQVAAAVATYDAGAATEQLNGRLALTADLAEAAGTSIANAFGEAGAAIGDIIKILGNYAKAQDEIDKQVANHTKTEAEGRAMTTSLQLSSYADLAHAAKGLFKEHSAGYEAMAAAEKAFAVIQAVNTVKNLAAGAAKMFATLGPWAFPAVAAMVAVMAGFGFSGGGGGAAHPEWSAEEMQKQQGTGTVLGDATAKSNSIANALDIMAKNSSAELEYSSASVRSLRNIETGIGALTSAIARQIGVSGGAFDSSSLGLGTNTSGGGIFGGIFGLGGLLSGIGKALFGTTTTKTLVDQGVQFYSATLGAIMQGGIQGANYQLVEVVKKKKFLGITTGTSTSYSTYTNALDSAVQDQAGLILSSIYESVVAAAGTIGIDGVEDLLKNFTVNLGKISLDGLKGDEIEQAISSVFSKAADDMTAFALPGVTQFQKVGEGLFETLMRLAKDYTTVDVQLASIGRTFGAVGVSSLEAREALIDLFGSLDDFVDQTGFYREHFLSDAEQLAPVIAAVNAEMDRLGLSGVTTIAQFKSVVDGLDLTTDAGRQMYAALMAVAQGFYAVDQYQSATASKRAELEIQLMEAQGNAAGALAAKRAAELAAMDESLRGLQTQIYLYQDIATAKDTLNAAYSRERDALTATISKFGDFSTSLKTFRDSLYTTDAGAGTYTSALAKLMQTGALAATGDEKALGDLQGVGSDFLSIAKSNARSLQDYQRSIALVAGYVNGGIAAADSAVDMAQAQLDQMTDAVSQLIDLNENVISVHDAITALQALLEQANPGYAVTAGGGLQAIMPEPQGGAAVVPAPSSAAATGATLDSVVDELANLRTAVEAVKVDTGKTARTLDRFQGEGVPIRNNDAGDAIVTEAA